MTDTLSAGEARKLVLLSQWPPADDTTADTTLAALRRLGYVQIDTLSVVARAHHHTLWNRNRRYQPARLTRLIERGEAFEYWAHAAAFLPMEDYRFSLRRMRAMAAGQRRWYARDDAMCKRVLARITAEGALRARDFDGATSGAMWDWKPAKQALEQLFMEGKLMAHREQFHKVYDLTERVLPPTTDTRPPSETEFARHLIHRYLRANGLGRAEEIAYLRPGDKPLIARTLDEMAAAGEVVSIGVRGDGGGISTTNQTPYHALPDATALLEQRLPSARLRILSPFDNLLIQRKRTLALFGFDYQLECYTPAAKRKHGYFSLPLLWRGRLVARIDCKADRPRQTLLLRAMTTEPTTQDPAPFAAALATALASFAAFNHCQTIEVLPLKDRKLAQLLRTELRRTAQFSSARKDPR